MTYYQVFLNVRDTLVQSDFENPDFAARQLIYEAFDLNSASYLLNKGENAPQVQCVKLLRNLGRVVSGEPLQYVLGKWEFMGHDFFVGNGVLIPRPETELLVESAFDLLSRSPKKRPVVFDLCAGSGCIGISIAKKFPNAFIYAVEKSEKALRYLKRNIVLNGMKNFKSVQYDICEGFDPAFFETPDLIVSNPPYVKSGDIPGLDSVVLREPSMALDGGEDGLDFYRVLVKRWLPALCPGGGAVFECGDGQGNEIDRMMCGLFEKTRVCNDLSGIDRVVCAENYTV